MTRRKKICYTEKKKGVVVKMERLRELFSEILDVRDIQGKRHCLMHIMVMSVCAILCGYRDFEDMYDYYKGREEWLDKHLGLWNGIPCSRT